MLLAIQAGPHVMSALRMQAAAVLMLLVILQRLSLHSVAETALYGRYTACAICHKWLLTVSNQAA
jgi:hypothetical protein